MERTPFIGREREREQIGDHAETAAVLSDLGLAELSQRNYDQAVTLLTRSVRLYREIGDLSGARHNYRYLTYTRMVSHQYEPALVTLAEWFSLLAPDERDERPLILVQMGLIHLHNGDYAAALAKNEEALAIFETSDKKEAMAGCLNNLITIHGDRGEYDQAEYAYFRSWLLCHEVSHVHGTWEAFWRIAVVYTDTNMDLARRAAQEAVAWARIDGQSLALTVAHLALDEVEFEGGAPLDAARVQATCGLADESERPELRVWGYATAARALARLGDRPAAQAALDAVRSLAEGVACPYRFRLKFLLAEAEALGSATAARHLCELAQAKGARPMLAHGLLLAGQREEARDLASH